MFTISRVEITLLDDPQQPRPAENLLGNTLQSVLQIPGHVRHHKLLWNRWLFNENQSGRTVDRGHEPGTHPYHKPSKEKGNQEVPSMPLTQPAIILPVDRFFGFFFRFVRH